MSCLKCDKNSFRRYGSSSLTLGFVLERTKNQQLVGLHTKYHTFINRGRHDKCCSQHSQCCGIFVLKRFLLLVNIVSWEIAHFVDGRLQHKKMEAKGRLSVVPAERFPSRWFIPFNLFKTRSLKHTTTKN